MTLVFLRDRFPSLLLHLMVSAFLSACATGPEAPPLLSITGPCTQAPVRATSRPYKINGIMYYPQAHYEYEAEGTSSFYGGGDVFHGRPTATGERFDMNGMTAAHKTLPLPCMAEVSNLENGRQIVVKVNDRGPFKEGRIIDVSRRAAQLLGFEQKGLAKVRVRTLVPETLALNNIASPSIMYAQAAPVPPPPVVESAPPVMMAALPAPVPEVAPPAPAYQPQSPLNTGIFIDVGRHATHEEALKLAQQLPCRGQFPATAVKHTGDAPYALRVGPLASLSLADKLLDKFTAAGRISRIIIQR